MTNEWMPNTIPPEEWRYISYDMIPNICDGYYISTYGRLYSSINSETYPNENNNAILDNKIYLSVYLRLRDGTIEQWFMHRLMMYVFKFIYDWESYEVNHIDGIKYHNWIWNLEWVTHEENVMHSIDTSLAKKGEDVSYSTITNEQADMIANLLSQGFRPFQIRDMLQDIFPKNVSIKQIATDMANGQSWCHITQNYDMSKAYNAVKIKGYPFTDQQTHQICAIYQKYSTYVPVLSILKYLGIDANALSKEDISRIGAHLSLIKHKKAKKEICDQYNY